MSLSTAERLALAVLNEDKEAVKMLVDCLQEDMGPEWSRYQVSPVKKITVPLERLRVAVYVNEDATIDRDDLEAAIRGWLLGNRIGLGLTGIDRIEIYELPENFTPQRPNDQVWPMRNPVTRGIPAINEEDARRHTLESAIYLTQDQWNEYMNSLRRDAFLSGTNAKPLNTDKPNG